MKIIYIVALTLFIAGCDYTGEESEVVIIDECPDTASCVAPDMRPIEIREIDFSQGIDIPSELSIEHWYTKYSYLEQENALLVLTFLGYDDRVSQLHYSIVFFEDDITPSEIADSIGFNTIESDKIIGGVHFAKGSEIYDDLYEILSAEYIGRITENDILFDQYIITIYLNFNDAISLDPTYAYDGPVIRQIHTPPVTYTFTVNEPVELEIEPLGSMFGLRPGDKIVSINGIAISDYLSDPELLSELNKTSGPRKYVIVDVDGTEHEIERK